MNITQAEVEAGAEALLKSFLGRTLDLRLVEAKVIAAIVLEAAGEEKE